MHAVCMLFAFVSGILVTASQVADNTYDYNIITVVLVTEVFKLVASLVLYWKEYVVERISCFFWD